ncbi:uncharacterized protein LOC111295832 isoform X2 [Durio zibethinus]|uniref:Uncharacterized protein LOC111295832 isoform X2 n=1 Tax=Durio zibethinus TaxID=66656 RepID=A0A6P5YYH6_DURZI|nr:uncharacterized protein LOC111295832 isoform X2 [Durio zibethinus]
MGKVKNVKFHEEVADVLQDLRFDRALKKKCSINKYLNETDMEEDMIDSDYERFFSSLEPDYDIFMENLEEDGIQELFSIELPSTSGAWEIISNEEQEEGPFQNGERKRNLKNDWRKGKAGVRQNLGGFLRRAKTKTPRSANKSLEIGTERSKNRVRKSPVDESKVNGEAVRCKSSRAPSKKMNCDMIDESFQVFLDSGFNESDDTNIHGNDDESSDLEILAVDNIPFHEGNYTPFVPSKCYQSLDGEESWDGIRTSSQSQFREKLMDLLKNPCDPNEFENLWREVTCRKPVQGAKVLRYGRMKSYSTKTNGKSYLDWYKELGMKIDEFRHDRRKILFLLRGFFFWLKNTAHEGAFQPWLDALYLNALG